MKIALLQMTSGPDLTANTEFLERSIREAATQGAKVIVTPENVDIAGTLPYEKLRMSLPEDGHPMITLGKTLSKELGVWILLGGVAIRIAADKFNNRSYLFSPSGEIAATYDKIHLFDADLPNGEVYRESDIVTPGNRLVTVDTDFGCAGLSICYDVRFPHLFRTLAKAGAVILFVPAAFVEATGKLHWEVLLRARAIENGVFVVAPNQCGHHGNGRRTYGHSMVVDPWGEILAEAGEVPEILYADIDLEEVSRFRSAVPSIHHDREFSGFQEGEK